MVRGDEDEDDLKGKVKDPKVQTMWEDVSCAQEFLSGGQAWEACVPPSPGGASSRQPSEQLSLPTDGRALRTGGHRESSSSRRPTSHRAPTARFTHGAHCPPHTRRPLPSQLSRVRSVPSWSVTYCRFKTRLLLPREESRMKQTKVKPKQNKYHPEFQRSTQHARFLNNPPAISLHRCDSVISDTFYLIPTSMQK